MTDGPATPDPEPPAAAPVDESPWRPVELTPHPDRLDRRRPDYEEILARHRRSVAAGADTYRDPRTGFFVFTAVYLWTRGYCCDNQCRHCPYVERPAPRIDQHEPSSGEGAP